MNDDTCNLFLVTQERGARPIRVQAPPWTPLTNAQAVNLAAWLLAFADPDLEELPRLLKRILEA